MQDQSSGRHHRFSPAAHELIVLMDGRHTVQEIWELAASHLGDRMPTQEEVIQVLGRLHAADVLQCDVPPDAREMFERFRSARRRETGGRFLNPLGMRFPLLDPDRQLVRFLPWVGGLFTAGGMVVWSLVLAVAALLCIRHWPELHEHAALHALAPSNLLLLALAYPAVKAVHELGHAFATRAWGGEVHEMGIMLLVFMPVPYVDASAAALFESKYQRMVTGAVGIMVELLLAALALFVWLAVEPGVVRDLAFNIMLIGGISTLFFNGNPLLKFDGYHVLVDALEIPNMGSRAVRYYGYLVQKYLFGVEPGPAPADTPGERRWLLVYGPAAFAYRLFILFAIALMLMEKVPVAGMVLAAWAVTIQVLLPVGKWLQFLLHSPLLMQRRQRAMAATAGLVLAAAVTVFIVPIPAATNAQGLVWPPEQSQVRAGTDCFVVRVHAADGSTVRQGQLLVEASDPFLDTQVRLLEAQLRELEARYISRQYEARVEAQKIGDEITAVTASLARMRQRQDALMIRSPGDGAFILPGAADLPGKYLGHGDVVGYVIGDSGVTARVVVPQEDVAQVLGATNAIEMRLADRSHEVIETTILRRVPGAANTLPGKALGSMAGGKIPVDPRDDRGTRTLASVFQFDLALPAGTGTALIGSRVDVRFDHGLEPAGVQWYRRLRQLFLHRLGA